MLPPFTACWFCTFKTSMPETRACFPVVVPGTCSQLFPAVFEACSGVHVRCRDGDIADGLVRVFGHLGHVPEGLLLLWSVAAPTTHPPLVSPLTCLHCHPPHLGLSSTLPPLPPALTSSPAHPWSFSSLVFYPSVSTHPASSHSPSSESDAWKQVSAKQHGSQWVAGICDASHYVTIICSVWDFRSLLCPGSLGAAPDVSLLPFLRRVALAVADGRCAVLRPAFSAALTSARPSVALLADSTPTPSQAQHGTARTVSSSTDDAPSHSGTQARTGAATEAWAGVGTGVGAGAGTGAGACAGDEGEEKGERRVPRRALRRLLEVQVALVLGQGLKDFAAAREALEQAQRDHWVSKCAAQVSTCSLCTACCGSRTQCGNCWVCDPGCVHTAVSRLCS